jgi:two-component system OmpR family sensor kinase
MFRVLLRLYLITIVTYSAAIFLIPKLVIQLFEHRYLDYNVEQSRGMQKLIVKQYLRAPVERWSQVTEQLGRDFAPLKVQLLLRQDASYSAQEAKLLEQGKPVIHLGEWGWMEDISSPLNDQFVVKLTVPPDPLDMNLLYWSMNVLIGAALLACLLFWLRPHWRDLERLKSTATQLGKGNLAERTHIPPSSNIGGVRYHGRRHRTPAQPAARLAQCGLP